MFSVADSKTEPKAPSSVDGAFCDSADHFFAVFADLKSELKAEASLDGVHCVCSCRLR